jgi:4-hydroxybenzoate polyprenyltransferase
MKEFLKLIRWQNLLIVIVTMVLMRYAVIEPLLGRVTITILDGTGAHLPMSLQCPLYCFILLVAATVFITAGGYVINDYFDIKTDLVNRGKVIVGTKIPRRQAMMWHNILNAAGVAAGVYVSWKAGSLWLGLLFLLVSGLLYFYSASYKRQFLIGNLIVAVLTAMVPFLVVIYEWPFVYRYYTANAIGVPSLNFMFWWIGGFSLFAFITTLAREILKDIEDYEGDQAYGMNTLPVTLGIKTSKIVVTGLLLITIASLYLIWAFYISDRITLLYLSMLVVVPLLYVIYLILLSKTRAQLHNASSIMKAVMLSGILYSLFLDAIITGNLI